MAYVTKLVTKDTWKNLLSILVGNTIFTLAVVMFIMPNGLISGGSTGLAIFLNRTLGISMPPFLFIFNGSLFLIGWYFLGNKFALSTIVSTIYYPFILGVLQSIPGLQMELEDKFVAIVFAGCLVGTGIGIVLRVDASTGGIDIPPLIFHKKFGIPVAVSLWTLDIIILLLQAIATDKESILYGIVLIAVYSAVLNKVLMIGTSQVQVKIISKEYAKINDMILTKMDRGSTLIKSQSGYCKDDGFVVLTVLTNRELTKLNKYVLEIDEHAFMIIHQVNEVKGKGFTLPKIEGNSAIE